MKITKEMGRDCLAELTDGRIRYGCSAALAAMGWTQPECFDYDESGFIDRDQLHTALAMCAAIAGVKPE